MAATAKMLMSRAGDTVRQDSPTARGFTLIELLVVLTVIALLATLATPMIQRTVPGVELKTAADLGHVRPGSRLRLEPEQR